MHANVGSIDRILRVGVGLGLLALVFLGPQTPWGYLGLALVATALIGWYPAYRLLGLCTTGKSAGGKTAEA